jgi:hypothetical protein
VTLHRYTSDKEERRGKGRAEHRWNQATKANPF